MEKWLRRIQDGVALQSARVATDALKELTLDDPDKNSDLTRVKLQLERIMTLLQQTDPVLAPQPSLEVLDSELSNLALISTQFRDTLDMGLLTSMSSTLDRCFIAASALPIPLYEGEGATSIAQVVAASLAAVDQIRTEVDSNLAAIRQSIEQQIASSAANADAISQSSAAVVALRTELSDLQSSVLGTLGSFQSTFTSEQSDRANGFREQLDVLRKDFDVLRETLSNESQRNLISFLEDVNRAIEKAQLTQLEIDKIYDLTSDKALIGDYSIQANAERKAANLWRRTAVGLGGVAVIVAAIFIALHNRSQNTDWEFLLLKALVVGAIGGISTYAVRQSSEHRHEQRANEHVALQLVTLKPYLKDFDSTTRDKLMADLAIQIFGPRTARDNSDGSLGQVGPGVALGVSALIKALKVEGLLK